MSGDQKTRVSGRALDKEVRMRTTITKRGQTVVPAAIRKRHSIGEGDHLVWLDEGSRILVIPMAADTIAALRGIGNGENLTRKLLEERLEERGKETRT